MAFAIFFGGMFVGFILGLTAMALLTADSLLAKPKVQWKTGVMLPVATPPASLGLRWRAGHSRSEVGYS